jgi:hypothetical protein
MLCMECMRQEWVAWFQSEDVGGVEGGPSVGQSERSKKGKKYSHPPRKLRKRRPRVRHRKLKWNYRHAKTITYCQVPPHPPVGPKKYLAEMGLLGSQRLTFPPSFCFKKNSSALPKISADAGKLLLSASSACANAFRSSGGSVGSHVSLECNLGARNE